MLKQEQLMERIVTELAKSAPDNCESFIFYAEYLRDPKLGLRNVSTNTCWIGEQQIPFDTSKGPCIKANRGIHSCVRGAFCTRRG